MYPHEFLNILHSAFSSSTKKTGGRREYLSKNSRDTSAPEKLETYKYFYFCLSTEMILDNCIIRSKIRLKAFRSGISIVKLICAVCSCLSIVEVRTLMLIFS